jgi:hypothetical protein
MAFDDELDPDEIEIPDDDDLEEEDDDLGLADDDLDDEDEDELSPKNLGAQGFGIEEEPETY